MFQAIGKLETLVNQVSKNSTDITTRLNFISNANLFEFPKQPSGLPAAKVSTIYFMF